MPKLTAAGWAQNLWGIAEQRTFTAGQIVVAGSKYHRKQKKRVDYLLRVAPDFPIAVVEAKAAYHTASAGMQQAKGYAQVLGLSFAYATNGREIIEFDFLTGLETTIPDFPTAAELWARLRVRSGLTEDQAKRLLVPFYPALNKEPRYYQHTAINLAVEAILKGQTRVLLTMATGTGKTFVAFQICWKLWSTGWNRTGEHRGPRTLFLADRTTLVEDPHDGVFSPFKDARHQIAGGNVIKSREMYFATYQAIARDERRPGLYREYPPDFFDLIVIDECHRGSARDDSNWREILEYYQPAFQLGMTATPLREENRDTYNYFGDSIYTYSLRQGIEDGFLAPYRVHRVVTSFDVDGWTPPKGTVDINGQEIPDRKYTTTDFERVISLPARTRAIAFHLTRYLRRTDRYGKTIVFCVDQEHAAEMRTALSNLNADLVQQDANYVCRVTSDEGDVGRGFLKKFQDVDTRFPVILTTSQLLTTGVDAPAVKNVVLIRLINSMTEFKQIIGRGTRVAEDCGKGFFTILDYAGSATTRFADPAFDGDPVASDSTTLDENGEEVTVTDETPPPEPDPADDYDDTGIIRDGPDGPRRIKLRYDGGAVQIVADVVHELDADGKTLRVVQLIDYTAERVRTLYPTATDLRRLWADPTRRSEISDALAERGIDFDDLSRAMNQPDADPFDLLCKLAYNAPLKTRRDRATVLRADRKAFFEQFPPAARQVLGELLDKYAEHGVSQLKVPDVLKVPPIANHGNIAEIAALFGGADALRNAVTEMQTLLYAS
jgi:type I restriction enzyme R subunit